MLLPLRTPLVALAAGATLVLCAPVSSAQDAKPPVAGTWKLDRERTVQTRNQTLQDPESSGGGAAVGMGTRGRPGARDNNAGTQSRGVQLTPAQRALVQTILRASDSILVATTDTSFTVDPFNGFLLNIATTGKAVEQLQPDGTAIKSKASWRGKDLIVEREMNTVGNTREVYKLDPNNPNELVIEFRYENKRQRRTVEQKRVYTRQAP